MRLPRRTRGSIAPGAGFAEVSVVGMGDRVDQVEQGLENLVDELVPVVRALQDAERHIEVLRREGRRAAGAITSREDDLRDLTSAVRRLTARVAWLEQHVRVSSDLVTADLDRVDDELSGLAATVAAGHEAAASVLPRRRRAELQQLVDSHRSAVGRRAGAVAELLESARRVSAAAPTDVAHRTVRRSYETARDTYLAATGEVEDFGAEAAAAVTRLDADDEARRREGAAIEAGEAAEVELMTRLRTRLADALGRDEMLPFWLTAAVGPAPLPGGAARWVEVASGLLGYRTVYRVRDAASALGDLPPSASAHRRTWFEELQRACRDLEG